MEFGGGDSEKMKQEDNERESEGKGERFNFPIVCYFLYYIFSRRTFAKSEDLENCHAMHIHDVRVSSGRFLIIRCNTPHVCFLAVLPARFSIDNNMVK